MEIFNISKTEHIIQVRGKWSTLTFEKFKKKLDEVFPKHNFIITDIK